jgi:hypothetical protein
MRVVFDSFAESHRTVRWISCLPFSPAAMDLRQ